MQKTIKILSENNQIGFLTKRLSKFGLQPDDWYLRIDSTNHIKIINKNEPSFTFQGKTEYQNGKPDWVSIQLFSL